MARVRCSPRAWHGDCPVQGDLIVTVIVTVPAQEMFIYLPVPLTFPREFPFSLSFPSCKVGPGASLLEGGGKDRSVTACARPPAWFLLLETSWLPAWEHSPGNSAEPVPWSNHVGLPRPGLRGRMPAPRVGTGAWGGTAEVCRAGAGLEAGGQPVGAGPGLGTEGSLLPGLIQARPLRAATTEVRKVSRRDRPRPRPDLLDGAVPKGTGREAGILGSDRGGWGGGRAAKQEEQTGPIQLLLAKTALTMMTHLGPGERPEPGTQKALSSSPGSVAV